MNDTIEQYPNKTDKQDFNLESREGITQLCKIRLLSF